MTARFAFVSFFYISSLFSGLESQERKINGDERKFKLIPVNEVKTLLAPTLDSGRLGVDLLIDGKLPKDGWRSTWTAWLKKNPTLIFNLGNEKRIGIIRIYFQPWDRSDELSEVKVEVSRDGETFLEFNQYQGFVSEKGKGVWAEMDLHAVKAQYFRLTPKYRGWGNLWGEVEFWEITN